MSKSGTINPAGSTWHHAHRGLAHRWRPSQQSILIVLGAGLAIYAALASLTWPFGADQGIFAWVGDVILRGGFPYKNAWDVKGPLTYYCYAFALILFGHHMWSIRVVDLLATATTAWLLYKLGLRLTRRNRFSAACSAIFFLLAYYSTGFWNTAQPDSWGGSLILGAALLLLELPRERMWYAVAGSSALITMAAMFKPTFFAFLVLPLVGAPIEPFSVRRFLHLAGACAISTLFVAAPAMLFFFAHDDLSALLNTYRFDAYTHAGLDKLRPMQEIKSIPWSLRPAGLLFPLLIAPIGLWHLHSRGRHQESVIVATWLALAIGIVLVQGKFWTYHWAPAVIALSATAGLCFSLIEDSAQTIKSGRWRGVLNIALFIATMVPVGLNVIFQCKSWPAYVMEREGAEQYVDQFQKADGSWKFSDFDAVSQYVTSHSAPGDAVLVWGWGPLINFLADRTSPTRFGYSYPVVENGSLETYYQGIFLNEVRKSSFKYLIVDDRHQWGLLDKTGTMLLHGFPEFDAFIENNYRMVDTIDGFQVWTRVH